MKYKSIVTITLFILIIIIFTFFIIRYSANLPQENNWFNRKFRAGFVYYPILRSVFNLHWDGDARSDYLSNKKFKKLLIEIDRYTNCQFSQKNIENIKSEIAPVVQKPLGVEIREDDIFDLSQSSLSREDLQQIIKKYKDNKAKNSQAVFYIICLNGFKDAPTNIGLSSGEDGAVIFWDEMKEISSENPASFDLFFESTVLHEFGHQVGLEHSNEPECLMNERVESPGNAAGALSEIPTKFCPQELQQIENLRNQYK